MAADRNLPDKCWKPKYGNDSRKWIFNYDPKLLSKEDPASTMRTEYMHPMVYSSGVRKDKARRREMLYNKLVQEMMDEIEREKWIPQEIEEYCTTYDDYFQIPGFKVDDNPPEDTELYLKHPLYHSAPVTVWSEIVEKETREVARIQGMTKIVDPLNPFKRNSKFSTRVTERLDEPEKS